ncbi:MAG: LuxR C-terminal-related transcriptional regulator [Acidimicrobiia bacterium]
MTTKSWDGMTPEEPPMGLTLCGPDGRFMEVNRAAADILGRPGADLVGAESTALVHPLDRPAEQARLAELVSGARTRYRLEQRYVRPDGEVRWVEVVASRGARKKGTTGPDVVRRMTDITDRRRHQAEATRNRTGERGAPDLLRRLSARERRILEHLAAGRTNREIARDLALAEKTVRNYVSNLLAKLDMHRRSEAAAYAARLDERGELDSTP